MNNEFVKTFRSLPFSYLNLVTHAVRDLTKFINEQEDEERLELVLQILHHFKDQKLKNTAVESLIAYGKSIDIEVLREVEALSPSVAPILNEKTSVSVIPVLFTNPKLIEHPNFYKVPNIYEICLPNEEVFAILESCQPDILNKAFGRNLLKNGGAKTISQIFKLVDDPSQINDYLAEWVLPESLISKGNINIALKQTEHVKKIENKGQLILDFFVMLREGFAECVPIVNRIAQSKHVLKNDLVHYLSDRTIGYSNTFISAANAGLPEPTHTSKEYAIEHFKWRAVDEGNQVIDKFKYISLSNIIKEGLPRYEYTARVPMKTYEFVRSLPSILKDGNYGVECKLLRFETLNEVFKYHTTARETIIKLVDFILDKDLPIDLGVRSRFACHLTDVISICSENNTKQSQELITNIIRKLKAAILKYHNDSCTSDYILGTDSCEGHKPICAIYKAFFSVIGMMSYIWERNQTKLLYDTDIQEILGDNVEEATLNNIDWRNPRYQTGASKAKIDLLTKFVSTTPSYVHKTKDYKHLILNNNSTKLKAELYGAKELYS